MRIVWLIVPALLLLGARAVESLDRARHLAGVDRARAEMGLTGRGVVVAVMDRGIDATHPALRNPDGTSRILAVLDLTDDSGAKAEDNALGVGTIHRKAAIDKALAAGTTPPIVDIEGRGTASAGIVCGNGRGSKDGLYAGVAPNAQLLVVRLKLDPPPEKVAKIEEGDEREIRDGDKEAFFDVRRLRAAMHWCIAEAKLIDRPLVMLMNYGQLGGPTDGGSKLCRV
ncbi:MAG: S8 family serine peptidase, partial [Planctomycetota bacterium]|nr:S8 family serine peptidase [Planctomycetota bacterium]